MTKNRILTVKHDEKFRLVIEEVSVESEKEFNKLAKDIITIGNSKMVELVDSELQKEEDTAFIDLRFNEEYLLLNAIPTAIVMSNGQLVQVHAGNMVVSKYDSESGKVGHLSDEDLKLFYTKYERAILPKHQTALISARHREVYGGPEAEWAGKPVEVFVFIRN